MNLDRIFQNENYICCMQGFLHLTTSLFSPISSSCSPQGKGKSRTGTCDPLLLYSSSLQLFSSRDSCCARGGFCVISNTQCIYFLCICPVLPWTRVSLWNLLSSYSPQMGRLSVFHFLLFSSFCFVYLLNCFKESWDLTTEVHQDFKDTIHCESWKHQE